MWYSPFHCTIFAHIHGEHTVTIKKKRHTHTNADKGTIKRFLHKVPELNKITKPSGVYTWHVIVDALTRVSWKNNSSISG